MNEYLVSWYSPQALGGFELHSPWWRAGWILDETHGEITVLIAAVRAESEDAAFEVIESAYYERPPAGVQRRSCQQIAPPYPWEREGTKFPLEDWHTW